MATRIRRVPAHAHFIWYGRNFPWVNALAIRSALERGGFERVVLHHDASLEDSPFFGELRAHAGFESRRLAPEKLFADPAPRARELRALHDRLRAPAARANLVRAWLLFREGGVYLDMDTVTVRSLDALREAGFFCGEEHLAWPADVVASRDPRRLTRALLLDGWRALCRRVPQGVAWFQRSEAMYARAVNNAIVGAAPGHPLLSSLLDAMLALPPERQLARYRLGTHLLQRQVATYGQTDLHVHPPPVFYPLGPEISHHWFRVRPRVDLGQVVSAQTCVVHWYASVENRALASRIDPAYVRRHRQRQLFSALAAPFAD